MHIYIYIYIYIHTRINIYTYKYVCVRIKGVSTLLYQTEDGVVDVRATAAMCQVLTSLNSSFEVKQNKFEINTAAM